MSIKSCLPLNGSGLYKNLFIKILLEMFVLIKGYIAIDLFIVFCVKFLVIIYVIDR